MATGSFILDSFTFTLDSLKYAEAERGHRLLLSVGAAAAGAGGHGNSSSNGASLSNGEAVRLEFPSSSTAGLQLAAAVEVPPTFTTSGPSPERPKGPPPATTAPGKKKKRRSVAPAPPPGKNVSTPHPLSRQIATARERIRAALVDPLNSTLRSAGEGEGEEMSSQVRSQVEDLTRAVAELRLRVLKLEGAAGSPATAPAPAAKREEKEEEEIDLFASSSSEEEAADSASQLRTQRLAAYAAKKAGKPVLVAKSNVILDVKPWDDETDMAELEKLVRTIEMDGLLWGASKLVPLAYGIRKLQIATVIEDERVSVDELQERIEGFEEFVQSVDIAAFNKI